MVEMVDSEDLGSSAVRRVGSSPTTRTKRDKQAETSLFVSFFSQIIEQILFGAVFQRNLLHFRIRSKP